MKRKLESLEVDFKEIDVEGSNGLVSKYGVRSIPLLMMVDEDGTVLREEIGNISLYTIKKTLGLLKLPAY